MQKYRDRTHVPISWLHQLSALATLNFIYTFFPQSRYQRYLTCKPCFLNIETFLCVCASVSKTTWALSDSGKHPHGVTFTRLTCTFLSVSACFRTHRSWYLKTGAQWISVTFMTPVSSSIYSVSWPGQVTAVFQSGWRGHNFYRHYQGMCAYLLSRVWSFATPWTVAHQAPLSIAFPRQEYWTSISSSKGSSWFRDWSLDGSLPHWPTDSSLRCHLGSPHNYPIRTLVLKIILEGSSAAFSPFLSSDFQQSNS